MARGRMLNTTIAKDKQLNDLSIEAEYIYLKVIPHLDRDGLINGNPALLWADVCPRRSEMMPKMQAIIDEIVASGLVISYECNGDTVLFFCGFSKNNTGMRYEREAASEFDPPPGYNRTRDGLTPANEDDEKPAKQVSGATPDKLRTNSGNCLGEVKDQDQDQRESTREAVQPAPTTNSAPPPLPNEYLPGLPDPRTKRTQSTQVAERTMQAKALGVDAMAFRLVVDALLDGFGKKALADAGDEKTMNHAQEVALIVMGISERFRTPAGVASVFKSWRENDWRGDSLPTSEQFKEHASLMAAGKVTCTRKDKPPEPAKPTKLNYRSWLLRNYNADNPQFITGVPKSELEKGYQDYVQQYH